jgi:hypothetical protein
MVESFLRETPSGMGKERRREPTPQEFEEAVNAAVRWIINDHIMEGKDTLFPDPTMVWDAESRRRFEQEVMKRVRGIAQEIANSESYPPDVKERAQKMLEKQTE